MQKTQQKTLFFVYFKVIRGGLQTFALHRPAATKLFLGMFYKLASDDL